MGTALDRFTKDLVALHSDYLMPDWEKTLKSNKEKGYNGYLGSLDCTHVGWHACPRAYSGSHRDRSGNISLILEALVDSDLRILHHYFGMPGGSNDLNVLHGSPLINSYEDDHYPKYTYTLSNQTFEEPYILVDGIYPKYNVFIRTEPNPRSERDRRYAAWQEGHHP